MVRLVDPLFISYHLQAIGSLIAIVSRFEPQIGRAIETSYGDSYGVVEINEFRSGPDGVVVDFTVIFTDVSVSDTADLQGTVSQTLSDASAAGTFGLPVVGRSISVSAPGMLVKI